jgi:hypothetical protein
MEYDIKHNPKLRPPVTEATRTLQGLWFPYCV